MLIKDTKMRDGKLWHIIKYKMLYELSEQAIRLLIGKRLFWFPKSKILLYKKSKTVELPDWLYQDKFDRSIPYGGKS